MTRPEIARRARRHRDGEPVFSEQWHAQVIAMVELLIADGKIKAEDWSQSLGAELDRRVTDSAIDTDATYYSAFLSALEQILDRSQFALQAEVDSREQDWRNAYLNTPHGQPVALAD
ncbi:nitrile hydratase subunit beta [Mesorhizobium sp. AR10]|uniref:SH3-like domain-containing protein n=1 Tax=Mesorhizobium sp. AR10 TaxID=2865839 RepID=UPI00215E10D2|nr:SH3-like domain-containing protein [Mesorhizobium sp. AR10]UVK36769.1 nitrile hydratase subunit beta [Mesorhizobium sp. AR10]